jgi:hypothetical protein
LEAFHINSEITMKRNGVEKTFYPNGQIRGEVTYVDDEVNGATRQWHQNGVLAREIPMRKGEIEGVVKQWNDKGELLGAYEIRNGTGVEKLWHENGKLIGEVSLVNGQFTGRQRTFFEDGVFAGDTYWIKNQKVSKKKYLEACAQDPSLPRYEDDDLRSTLKLPSTKYRLRKTPVSDAERSKHDEFITKFRANPNQAEARQWLATGPAGAIRTLGEMDLDGSLEVVEEGYTAGAQKIIAVNIQSDNEKNETTDHLIVEIPAKGLKRKRAFEWVNELAQQSGFDPEDDWGQGELFIFFD